MGLTRQSVGIKASPDYINNHEKNQPIIALAGNPNVGKSTVFNALTGMHQHTGNWTGKTVGNARGICRINDTLCALVDIPGTYSLIAHSAEEKIARNYICFSGCDAVVIVCDATCLKRNMNFVLQTLEVTSRVVLCVNLMDEAIRKHIAIDCQKLSSILGIPVIPTSARRGKGLQELTAAIGEVLKTCPVPLKVSYRPDIEEAIAKIESDIISLTNRLPSRFLSLRLLDGDPDFLEDIEAFLEKPLAGDSHIKKTLSEAKADLMQKGYDSDTLRDALVFDLFRVADAITKEAIKSRSDRDLHKKSLDKFLTGKITGIPVMLALLLFILWLTISGANYPSQWLSALLFSFEEPLLALCRFLHLPILIQDALVFGIYRTLAWVVSVMLPPMAIFFPLFTLLEDAGYLPRVAFNLDNTFKKCCACGKQALTMCMGFGCNAVGVIGSRIIDSPRERLIAIVTNSFVPCNGRFPTLISIITMFFIMGATGFLSSLYAAFLLTLLILLSIVMTFFTSRILSKTVLKGIPSSFTLELPPYRPPQVGKILVRSVFDRTLFVLGRAVSVAAPAGLIIYIMANVSTNGITLLKCAAGFLDPFARLIGLDGVLLMAFILGFPANEIVMPIAIMAYMSQGTLTEFENLTALKTLLVNSGWTPLTAACTMIFSLMHWPCSTTLLSIKKETKSLRWTLLAFLLPTVCGIALCFLLTTVVRIISLL